MNHMGGQESALGNTTKHRCELLTVL
jgi:hypothetical protein